MRAVFAYEDVSFADGIAHAARLLLSALDLDLHCTSYAHLPGVGAADLLVTYGGPPPDSCGGAWAGRPHLHFPAHEFFGPGFLAPGSASASPPMIHAGVPVVFASQGQALRLDGRRLDAALDLIASAFFLSSRYEEFVSPERDRFDRFQPHSAYAHRHGFSHRPVIDEYVSLLQSWLRELGAAVERRPLPKGHAFAVCLTHDIDKVDGGWLEAGFHTLKQLHRPARSAGDIVRLVANKVDRRDPYWNLEDILAIEERHGARSSFYFLPRTGHAQDARYDFHEDRFRTVFKRMREGNWEIGLHGSYESAYGEGMLAAQRRALEEASGGTVTGVRQHFLRLPEREGWRRQEEAGFEYDTTLAYAGGAGFRAGLARPFQAFDLTRRRALDLWEVPLVAMDQTFRAYRRLPVERVWEEIRPLLEQIRAHRGAGAILWHNTFFSGYKFAGYEQIYEQILSWVRSNGGACTTAAQAVEWWRGR